WSQGLGKEARKQFIVHPNSQTPARDAWLGNLKDRGADLPTLTDKGVVHLNPFGGEILAKLAVSKRATDLLLPPPCVFDGVRVDHFVGSAMCAAVRLVVAGKVHISDCDPADDDTSRSSPSLYKALNRPVRVLIFKRRPFFRSFSPTHPVA